MPGVAAGLVGSSYPISTHAGGLDGLRAGVVVQQSRSDPDLPAADAEDMDGWGEKTWLTVPLVLERTTARRDDPHRDRAASAASTPTRSAWPG